MLGIRHHWCMVVVGPHHCLAVVVVGSLRGLSMVVVGPRGWWWVCSSPLFSNGGGLLVLSHCHVASSLHGVVDVQSSSVIVTFVHLLGPVTWHCKVTHVVLCAVVVVGHQQRMCVVAMGGTGSVSWMMMVVRGRQGCGLLSMLMASKSSLGVCQC